MTGRESLAERERDGYSIAQLEQNTKQHYVTQLQLKLLHGGGSGRLKEGGKGSGGASLETPIYYSAILVTL